MPLETKHWFSQVWHRGASGKTNGFPRSGKRYLWKNTSFPWWTKGYPQKNKDSTRFCKEAPFEKHTFGKGSPSDKHWFPRCVEAERTQASIQKAAGAAKWSETMVKISHMCFRGARKLKSRRLPLKKPREQPICHETCLKSAIRASGGTQKLQSRKLPLKKPREQPNGQRPL